MYAMYVIKIINYALFIKYICTLYKILIVYLVNGLIPIQHFNRIFITGSLLSAHFSRIEEAVIFSLVYEYLALPLCGAYLSFRQV